MSAAGKSVYKLFGVVGGVLAAKAARSALDKGWARTRGGEPPRNPAVPGVTWADGLAWAVASGIAVGVAKLVVTKGIASGWARATGHLPPGVEEVGN